MRVVPQYAKAAGVMQTPSDEEWIELTEEAVEKHAVTLDMLSKAWGVHPNKYTAVVIAGAGGDDNLGRSDDS